MLMVMVGRDKKWYGDLDRKRLIRRDKEEGERDSVGGTRRRKE
jgi:hypothetical protein